MKKIVILMVGVSGSGKSTRAFEIAENLHQQGIGFDLVSADHFFLTDEDEYVFDPSKLGEAHSACQCAFVESLAEGVNVVIVDNTNLRRWERQIYIEIAKALGYDVWLEVLPFDVERCAERNQHGVPRYRIEQMAQALDIKPGRYHHLDLRANTIENSGEVLRDQSGVH